MKKLLSIILCLAMSLNVFMGISFANTEEVSVRILADNDNVRIVEAIEDGILTKVTFYKEQGSFEFETNNQKVYISKNEMESKACEINNLLNNNLPNDDRLNMSLGENLSPLASEEIHDLGYQKLWNNSRNSVQWNLDGPGWNSYTIYAKDAQPYVLEQVSTFTLSVDKAKEYWILTQGALIGAGATAIVGIVLALLPEPMLSKGAATAALVAAGASVSAATAAGGTYYASSYYYNRAQDAFRNL